MMKFNATAVGDGALTNATDFLMPATKRAVKNVGSWMYVRLQDATKNNRSCARVLYELTRIHGIDLSKDLKETGDTTAN